VRHHGLSADLVHAHAERDFDFAKAHGIEIVEVVSPTGEPSEGPLAEAFAGEGVAVRSGKYDGMKTAAMKSAILDDLEKDGVGTRRVEYKLRDWVFSRQRYWGEPIPIYFPVSTDGDPRAGAEYTIHYDRPLAVQVSELPIRLPDLEDYRPGEDPAGVLARAKDWRFFQRDGKWFARETNTMPQWAGSCWYYLRFMDPANDAEAWSAAAAKRWLPVDLYVGGAEHAVLHLLYARFWHKVLHDAGLVPCPEPFTKLVHQGMILGGVEYTGYKTAAGTWVSQERVASGRVKGTDEEAIAVSLSEDDLEKGKGGAWVLKSDPSIVVDARAHKMSKARGNVVNPDDIVRQFGADAMRVYEMFMGPLEATKPWSTSSIGGVRRFLDRVFTVAQKASSEAEADEALLRALHKTIQKVGDDIEAMRFNTAVSAMMVLTNELAKLEAPPADVVSALAQLLHPFAPHLAEEMWEMLGHAPSVQAAPWPSYDPALLVEDTVEVPVQVLGKVRGKVTLPADATEAQALEAARAVPNVASQLEGKTLRKVIWVPGKILNLIAS